MEVIAAKVPLIEAFGKRKCHQSCQSWTRDKMTGLKADQDTHRDCTNLELTFLFGIIFFLVSSGVERGGEEKENGRAEWGAVGTWVKNAKPEQCYFFLFLSSHRSIPTTPRQLR